MPWFSKKVSKWPSSKEQRPRSSLFKSLQKRWLDPAFLLKRPTIKFHKFFSLVEQKKNRLQRLTSKQIRGPRPVSSQPSTWSPSKSMSSTRRIKPSPSSFRPTLTSPASRFAVPLTRVSRILANHLRANGIGFASRTLILTTFISRPLLSMRISYSFSPEVNQRTPSRSAAHSCWSSRSKVMTAKLRSL